MIGLDFSMLHLVDLCNSAKKLFAWEQLFLYVDKLKLLLLQSGSCAFGLELGSNWKGVKVATLRLVYKRQCNLQAK